MPKAPSAAALFDKGLALVRAHRLPAAAEALRSALAADPAHDDARRLYAVVLTAQGHLDEALPLQQDLLQRHPDAPAVLESHVLLLSRLGRANDAWTVLQRALTQLPDSLALLVQWAQLAVALARYDEALAVARRAIALAPTDATAHAAFAMVAMLAGAYRLAVPHYAARHTLAGGGAEASSWQGQAASGQPLWVRHEQGFGDTLQMARFFRAVRRQAGGAVFQVQKPLLRLLRRNFPELDLRDDAPRRPTGGPHAWTMDLPAWFAPSTAQVDGTPYLTADGAAAAAWAARLGPGRHVGLVWAGNRQHLHDRRRSLSADALSRLLATPGASWVSLQLPGGTAPAGMVDLTARLRDFEDTAALIAALDLVVTVDTAVAHLAAALGKETWVLLSTPFDWRWGVEGATTPWYRSARLYRRGPDQPWDDVVDRVTADLAQRLS